MIDTVERTESVVVCAFALGAPLYFAALRETVRSALRYTAFDIFALVGAECPLRLLANRRVHQLPLKGSPGNHRSYNFLAKFRVLQHCLEQSDADLILYLDADAVFTRQVTAADVRAALAGRELGMVEQVPPPGSEHSRAFFFDHYCNHTRRWFAAPGGPPPLERFHYFNSGVVLARRAGVEKFCAWALRTVNRLGARHEVGAHMIGDQDYFQFWANELCPESTTLLDWSWNHCEHWDGDFPRHGVRVAHLSNACHGPTSRSIWRLKALRTSPRIERVWRQVRHAPLFGAAIRRGLAQAPRGA